MYLDSGERTECFGCEACVQICGKNAILMEEDEEGFRYPSINNAACIDCGLCRSVCPDEHVPGKNGGVRYVFGGYHKNPEVRFNSTSGGAFTSIVDAFCDENYVIFGAAASGLKTIHRYTKDKREAAQFRKSKYTQSVIRAAYKEAKQFLREGKKVLFSGTPCQIAGLLSFLGDTSRDNLLTVEVVCEGVPSPLYLRKLDKFVLEKKGAPIESVDYRYTGKSIFQHGKWDFQIMRLSLSGSNKTLSKDRWFNPFWSLWLSHLMSRPACYQCKFATPDRVADITLGDLWGVHLYCPELYGNNGGSSLVVCNTDKGKRVFRLAQESMFGHELEFEEALKYQSPMRRTIGMNPDREAFMSDLKSDMDYQSINKKWARKPTLELVFQKYCWGNRQKIAVWTISRKLKINRRKA